MELDDLVFEKKKIHISTPKRSHFLQSKRYDYYCLLCRVKTVAPVHPKLNQPLHLFRVLLTALVFTLVCWNWLSWVGLFSFVPFWVVFELVYRIRLRTGFECKVCGFDPYLYLQDVQKAKAQVNSRLRQTYAEKGVPYPEKKINAALESEQVQLAKEAQSLFENSADSTQ